MVIFSYTGLLQVKISHKNLGSYFLTHTVYFMLTTIWRIKMIIDVTLYLRVE